MKLPQKKHATQNIVVAASIVLAIGLLSGFSTKTLEKEEIPESQTRVMEEPNLAVAAQSQHEVLAAHASNEVKTVLPLDRTKPIYAVYKNGQPIYVPTEWQWYIRDMAEKYGFAEKYIYGCILAESTFTANAKGDSGKSLGLAQIQKYWIRGANIKHFTDDYRKRDLLNPYHNILTLMEIWCYSRDAYGINTGTTQGMKDLLYLHNTGKYVKNVKWDYSNKVIRYSNELIQLQFQ